MGTIMRLSGVRFTNPDLPVIQIPYTGITSGLLGAYHPHLKSAFVQPVASDSATPAPASSLIGSPTFSDAFMSGSGSAGIETSIAVPAAYTMCAVYRRPSGVTGAGWAVSVANGTGGDRVFFSDAGFRVQAAATSPAGLASFLWVESDFEALDALVDADKWEFLAFTVDENAQTAYAPRVGWSASKDGKGYSPYYGGKGYTANVAVEKATSFAGAPVDVAFASIFRRVLGADEVATQYVAARDYCAQMGITLGA